VTLNNEGPEYGKPFLLSAGAGSIFGLVAGMLAYRAETYPWPAPIFIAGATLLSGLFSGLAGLGGAYLDERLRRSGLEKAPIRLFISFGAVALLTVALAYLGITLFGAAPLSSEVRQTAATGIAAGLAFGAVFALGNYLLWRNRQKMMLLEMENRHLAELASREDLLREAAYNLAVSEERNRMARELHDTISQGVHGIVYSLRSLRAVLEGSERGMEILGHLEQTAGETLQELRRLVAELSPSPLENLGLCEALRRHCGLLVRRQDLALELRLDYSGGLLPGQEAAIYRIVQEALANAWRHSGAGQVGVELIGDHDGVALTVRDNGRGFDPAKTPRGHGLANMETRALQNGGRFSIRSAPGEGTEIRVFFPKVTRDGSPVT
jgi:signal transduction histidine kinase